MAGSNETWRGALSRGVVIPAHPLALDGSRKLDERRQRALTRYYIDAGAGGLAVGVHTTQFAIRDAKHGLLEPVLSIAAEEINRRARREFVRIAGVCGQTRQALAEASLARERGFHAGLLSLAAFAGATDDQLVEHARQVAEVLPVVGFYLQPAAGGRLLPFSFWRRFVEIPNVVAIKIAPFNRYQTLDVVRAVVEAGREDITLYTGNDDTIVSDLLTPFRFLRGSTVVERRIVGGLLGHWSVWTKRAVELLDRCHAAVDQPNGIDRQLLADAAAVTDCNAAFFDAANGFAGCIPGLHEVLRRQGILQGTWCLDEHETLGPGQSQQIDRVYKTYPNLNDDEFVARHVDSWLS